MSRRRVAGAPRVGALAGTAAAADRSRQEAHARVNLDRTDRPHLQGTVLRAPGRKARLPAIADVPSGAGMFPDGALESAAPPFVSR